MSYSRPVKRALLSFCISGDVRQRHQAKDSAHAFFVDDVVWRLFSEFTHGPHYRFCACADGTVSGLGIGILKRHALPMNEHVEKRPDWDTYFIDIAHVVAKRSNCSRRQVAAIIVVDKRIISTGYNGTPRGIKNCFEGGCPRCASNTASGSNLDDCICAHAEENAIVQGAYHGISVCGGVLYCTISPCLMCAKMIVNAGLVEVVYEHEYHFSKQARALFRQAGVKCRKFKRKQ